MWGAVTGSVGMADGLAANKKMSVMDKAPLRLGISAQGNSYTVREVLCVVKELLQMQEVRLCSALVDDLCCWSPLADSRLSCAEADIRMHLQNFVDLQRRLESNEAYDVLSQFPRSMGRRTSKASMGGNPFEKSPRSSTKLDASGSARLSASSGKRSSSTGKSRRSKRSSKAEKETPEISQTPSSVPTVMPIPGHQPPTMHVDSDIPEIPTSDSSTPVQAFHLGSTRQSDERSSLKSTSSGISEGSQGSSAYESTQMPIVKSAFIQETVEEGEEDEETDESELEWSSDENHISDDEEDEKGEGAGSKTSEEFRRQAHSMIGNFEAIREADTRTLAKPSHNFIIHPSSPYRMAFDGFSLLLIVVEAICVPLALGFDIQPNEIWFWLLTCFFLIDLCSHFITGFFKHGILVMRQEMILRNYFQTWFLLDLAATLPWEAMIRESGHSEAEDAGQSASMVRFARVGKMLRMFRLLRVFKIKDLYAQMEELLSSYTYMAALSLVKMVIIFSVLCHWSACMWGYLGVPSNTKHPSAGNEPHDISECEFGGPCEPSVEGSPWIRRYGLENFPANTRYLISLHFAAGLLTGSEMDLQAGYAGERVYVILMMLVSILVCSLFVSRIVVMGQRLGASRAELVERLRRVKAFMASRKVPMNLQTKVKRYLEYQHKAQSSEPHESGFMDRLSPWLRLELTEHMNHAIITRHPFFLDLPSSMLKRICGAARTVLCAPGDVVVQRGHVASGMCYIIRGKLKILRAKKSKQPLGKKESIYLSSPCWIGDLCLFQEMERTNTVVSMTHSELLTVSKDSLMLLLDEFPKARVCYEEYRLRVSRGDLSAAGVKCNFCHSPGHFVGDCPEFRKQANAGNKGSDAEAPKGAMGAIGTWFRNAADTAGEKMGMGHRSSKARGRSRVVFAHEDSTGKTLKGSIRQSFRRVSGKVAELGSRMAMKRRTGVSAGIADANSPTRSSVQVVQTATEPFSNRKDVVPGSQ